MSKFSVGEIAVFQPSSKSWRGIAGPGSECELVERFINGHGDVWWWCRFPGDPCPADERGLWEISEQSLRKRRPPEAYKDQFTPATKPLDEIIRTINCEENQAKDPDLA